MRSLTHVQMNIVSHDAALFYYFLLTFNNYQDAVLSDLGFSRSVDGDYSDEPDLWSLNHDQVNIVSYDHDAVLFYNRRLLLMIRMLF